MSRHTRQALNDAYERVTERIGRAAERAGRQPWDVTLVAVTKSATPEQVRWLAELGQRDLAENRAQALLERARSMAEQGYPLDDAPLAGGAGQAGMFVVGGGLACGVRWHMIGRLQRNKVRSMLGTPQLIHSVDSLRLAECLSDEAQKLWGEGSEQGPSEHRHRQDVLMQVNVSGEASKAGVPAPEATALAERIAEMPALRLRGLMTLAPYSDDPEDARPVFARAAELFEAIRARLAGMGDGEPAAPAAADRLLNFPGPDGGTFRLPAEATAPRRLGFDLLSMGMSGDFEVAIEEGANVVRIGTALFTDLD
ncbi:MAG: YggS family pyridoxal phosphate enzyme [Phycisphaeraceae bacterium]|nr:YggS family pyridoxal phosphate enzyme [Phycisphaeraceae bacterium]